MQQPRKAAESAEDVVVVRLLRIIGSIPLALRELSRIKVNQAESNQIKPAVVGEKTRMKDEAAKPRHSRAVKSGQTRSNPIWALVLEIELRLEGVRTN